ncbi:pseudouridine synthase [uncultured Desulfuromonas sp.]|uniref:pseudouridine synthase n=1 Tax=uncultured Desulfuromonas sp. TaxID=181013 RepID=UPI00262E3C3D|nr:pseudouridine synthase [uncultured Desulfuromonas sp.]
MTGEALDILYSDEHLVVVDKPAGLLVHRSPIDRRETRFALQIVRDQLGRRVYPAHRLDKPTSGALLFGLCPESAARLSGLFAGGEVEKAYLAVVRGVAAEHGVIDHPLAERPEKLRDPREGEPRRAITEYRRLAAVELPFAVGRYPTSRYSLVEARPRTGRRHQLRRHFKHVFHPIVGDTKYGEGRHNRFFREDLASSRMLLAAVEISFDHPFTGRRVSVPAPLSAGFRTVIDRLGWSGSVPSRWLARGEFGATIDSENGP